MPGGRWERDRGYELFEGSGLGTTRDPRGMQWAPAAGEALYFADFGNNEIQKLADPNSFGSSYLLDQGGVGTDSLPLAHPVDVAIDSAGYVYVADTGNRRVLRFAPDGSFKQRVDIEPDESDLPLDDAVAVAAGNEQVYVADRGRAEVVRYRRRK